MNEKALIKKCQRGDKQAFEELIRLYYDYVSGFLLKTTMASTLSEDLTQETFLKMIRSIEKFDPGGSAAFGTWLITIAKNCYIDHLRRNRVPLEDICRNGRVSLPGAAELCMAVFPARGSKRPGKTARCGTENSICVHGCRRCADSGRE